MTKQTIGSGIQPQVPADTGFNANALAAKPLYAGSATIWIDASPAVIYALVSDITRMGTYSPGCYHCKWINGANSPVVGAHFKGYDKWHGVTWARTAVVTVANPGREFTFRTVATRMYPDSTTWRYVFEPVAGGTQVTESYALMYAGILIRILERVSGRPDEMPGAMQRTLERIKAVAEGQALPL